MLAAYSFRQAFHLFYFFLIKGKMRVCFSQGSKQEGFITVRFSRDWQGIYMITVTDGVADSSNRLL